MAIKYEISRWRFPTSMEASAYHCVSRGDVAERRVWQEIYAMLEANGLLDRPVARRLLAEFEQSAADGTFSAPARGYMRSQKFYLDANRLDGPRVEFFALRV